MKPIPILVLSSKPDNTGRLAALKAGWRLELIQQAFGYKHIETTIKYLNIVDDELLDASREFYEKHSAIYGVEKLL